MNKKRQTIPTAQIAVLSIVLAGCGGGGAAVDVVSSGGSPAAETPAAPPPGPPGGGFSATVSTPDDSGRIRVR